MHVACFADSAKTTRHLARPPPLNVTMTLWFPQIVWTSALTYMHINCMQGRSQQIEKGGSLLADSGPSLGFVCVVPVPCLSHCKTLMSHITYHQILYKLFPTLHVCLINVYQCNKSSTKAKLYAPTSLYCVEQKHPQTP